MLSITGLSFRSIHMIANRLIIVPVIPRAPATTVNSNFEACFSLYFWNVSNFHRYSSQYMNVAEQALYMLVQWHL